MWTRSRWIYSGSRKRARRYRDHIAALHPRTSPSQVSRPYSFAFLPNDRGVFAPSLVVALVIPAGGANSSLSLSLSPAVINHLSPGRWISHFPPDFPATTVISPSKCGSQPPFATSSASTLAPLARQKNEEEVVLPSRHRHQGITAGSRRAPGLCLHGSEDPNIRQRIQTFFLIYRKINEKS